MEIKMTKNSPAYQLNAEKKHNKWPKLLKIMVMHYHDVTSGFLEIRCEQK